MGRLVPDANRVHADPAPPFRIPASAVSKKRSRPRKDAPSRAQQQYAAADTSDSRVQLESRSLLDKTTAANPQSLLQSAADGGGAPSKDGGDVAVSIASGGEGGEVGGDKVEPDKLKKKQKKIGLGTLMAVFAVLGYLAAGAWFFSFEEDWTYIDAFYFGTVTFTTVGYGDLLPKSDVAKYFTCLFSVFGITVVTIAIGQLTSSMLEMQRHLADEVRSKAMAMALSGPSVLTRLVSSGPNEAAKKARPKWLVWLKRNRKKITTFFGVGLFYLGGILFFVFVEERRFVDAFYWVVITTTTVGYGDITPVTQAGRVFTCFYIILGVAIFGKVVGDVARAVARTNTVQSAQDLFAKPLTGEMLTDMDTDGDGKVDRLEFLSYVLVLMGKMSRVELAEVMQTFSRLDKDGSGDLDIADLLALTAPTTAMMDRIAALDDEDLWDEY
jgi:potassium channel subfamily K